MRQIVTREQQDLRQPILSIKIRTPHWRFLNFDKPKSEKPHSFLPEPTVCTSKTQTPIIYNNPDRERKKSSLPAVVVGKSPISAPLGCQDTIFSQARFTKSQLCYENPPVDEPNPIHKKPATAAREKGQNFQKSAYRTDQPPRSR